MKMKKGPLLLKVSYGNELIKVSITLTWYELHFPGLGGIKIIVEITTIKI